MCGKYTIANSIAWLIKNDFTLALCEIDSSVLPCEWNVIHYSMKFFQQPLFLTLFNFRTNGDEWMTWNSHQSHAKFAAGYIFWATHSIVIMFQSCYIEMLSNHSCMLWNVENIWKFHWRKRLLTHHHLWDVELLYFSMILNCSNDSSSFSH
jgi:hypothetical protein